MTKTITDKSIQKKYLFKEIIRVALPMALQSVLLTAVQLIDNLFIGHLKDATDIASALNAINNITFIITTVVIGFMGGIGVYFAHASGKNDEQIKKILFIAKIFWTFIFSLILISIAVIWLSQISKIWLPNDQNTDRAQDAAAAYGLIIFPSLFIDYIVIIFSSSFKEQKKTKIAMIIAIIAILVNSALNYPFMYILGWGVRGSAYATLIARLLELIIWLSYILIMKPTFVLGLKKALINSWRKIFIVFPKSFWWMFNNLITTLAFVLQIMFMSRLSLSAGASLNAAGVVSQIMNAFNGGFATAITIVIMHKLAKGINFNFKKYIKNLWMISALFGLLTGTLLVSASYSVFGLYPNYTNYTKWQSMIMLWSIGSLAWVGLINVVFTSVLKGGGYTKKLIAWDGLYSWIITLPVTIVLVYFAKNLIDFGYIYWIIGLSGIFKPIILSTFFNKISDKFNVIKIHDGKTKKWKYNEFGGSNNDKKSGK